MHEVGRKEETGHVIQFSREKDAKAKIQKSQRSFVLAERITPWAVPEALMPLLYCFILGCLWQRNVVTVSPPLPAPRPHAHTCARTQTHTLGHSNRLRTHLKHS